MEEAKKSQKWSMCFGIGQIADALFVYLPRMVRVVRKDSNTLSTTCSQKPNKRSTTLGRK